MWPDSKGLNCTVLTRCPRVTSPRWFEGVRVRYSIRQPPKRNHDGGYKIGHATATEVNYPLHCPGARRSSAARGED